MNKKAQAAGLPMNYLVLIIIGVLVVVATFYLMTRSGLTQRVNELPFEEYEVDETVPVVDTCPFSTEGAISSDKKILRESISPSTEKVTFYPTNFYINSNNNIMLNNPSVIAGKYEPNARNLRFSCWILDTGSELYDKYQLPVQFSQPFFESVQNSFVIPISVDGRMNLCRATEKEDISGPKTCYGSSTLNYGIKTFFTIGELLSMTRNGKTIVSREKSSEPALSSNEIQHCKTQPINIDLAWVYYFWIIRSSPTLTISFMFDKNTNEAYLEYNIENPNFITVGKDYPAFISGGPLGSVQPATRVYSLKYFQSVSSQDTLNKIEKIFESDVKADARPLLAQTIYNVLSAKDIESFHNEVNKFMNDFAKPNKLTYDSDDTVNQKLSGLLNTCSNTWYCDFGAGPEECSLDGASLCSKTDSTKCIEYKWGDKFAFSFKNCVYTYELRGDMLKLLGTPQCQK
jgi:hypothetical protein